MSRPSIFLFLADAEAEHHLDRVPEDERDRQRVDGDRGDALELRDQQRHAAAVEQAVACRRAGDLVHREQADADACRRRR